MMSQPLTLESLRAEGLLPFQAQFVLDFLREGSPPHQQLAAAAGTGKLVCAAAIVARSVGERKRVLVLCPAALVQQWVYVLPQRGVQATVLAVDRSRYRELVDGTPLGSSPWPQSAVVVMSDDFAKQDDIAASLARVTWELVVVDEAPRMVGTRRALLERLLRDKVATRSLLLTIPTPELASASQVTDIATTVWSGDLTDWEGRSLASGRQRRLAVIDYSRSRDERHLLDQLHALPQEMVESPASRLVGMSLMRAAISSFNALEQVLRTIRNRAAHGSPFESSTQPALPDNDEDFDFADVGQEDVPSGTGSRDESGSYYVPRHVAAILRLLEVLETVRRDTKYEALAKRVAACCADDSAMPMCIVCTYQATAAYLSASLSESCEQVSLVTGSSRMDERREALLRMKDSRGILVATTAAVTGVDLAFANTVIAYDLPRSPEAMERLWGRFDRYGRDRPCTMLALRDKSNSVPFESEVLRSHGFI